MMKKKVLIVSQPGDYTTSLVVQWLRFFRVSFVRLDYKKRVGHLKIELGGETENFELKTKDADIDFSELNAYWYRRGQINFSGNSIVPEKDEDQVYAKLAVALSKELSVINHYAHKALSRLKSLNSYFNKSLNKIDVLYQAKECGLKIPQTLVASSKKDVVAFQKKHTKLIVKPAFEAPFFLDKNIGSVVAYTSVLSSNLLDEMAEIFFPSLFQEFINKRFEIRAFFLNGAFYSTAIFSQGNKNTETDYRNKMLTARNRNVPFKLPAHIENKISNLMDALDLNCGSVDLILSTSGEFVFLEVNPIGQFSKISKVNNYFLEKKIATFLAS